MQDYLTTLSDAFIAEIPNFLTAILIVLISFYGGSLLGKLLRRVLEKNKVEPGITDLLSNSLKWAIFSMGVITALQRFFNVTAFLTGLGIIGFTIGFALQNIMQNFVSGVILLIQQPFRVGDAVHITSFDGTILQVGLRTTEMKTLDGRIVFLPNADILAQPIINYTRAKLRRIELPIGVAYDSDTDLVRSTIMNEIPNVNGFIDDPAPRILFHTFGASSIDLTVYFWINVVDNVSPLAAQDEALTLINAAFKKNKIEIPYPIQVQYNKSIPEKTTRRKTK